MIICMSQVTNLTCEDEQTLHLEWITALPDTQVLFSEKKEKCKKT